ncbi:MAG: hypothetical protein J07HX5_01704 [halophilic archaeon J07HX5]|nr:MAG: hypothetical protein J07HX5_01704 [halophilic archaeon J07HX5]
MFAIAWIARVVLLASILSRVNCSYIRNRSDTYRAWIQQLSSVVFTLFGLNHSQKGCESPRSSRE